MDPRASGKDKTRLVSTEEIAHRDASLSAREDRGEQAGGQINISGVDSDILDRVYEAAAVPELWTDVLERMATIAGARSAALLVFDPARRLQYISTPDYAELLADFAGNSEGYDNRRPRRALATGHAGFLHDLELFTQAELDADPIYRDFLLPFGIKWTAGSVIPVPTSDLLVFDFVRSEGQGPFDRQAMRRLDAYRPHLARAALLAHRLGLRSATAATDAMETIGLPAAMIAAGGRVLSANGLLEALAPRVRIAAFDRIMFGPPAADRMLVEALATIAAPAGAAVRSIPLPATAAFPALIGHLIPIRRAAGDIFANAAAMLVVTSVTAPAAPLTEVLTGLFDLTPAEVRAARGIVTGLTVAQMARSSGLSKETVRSQLKSAMAKTGTARQTDLALLLSGASPIRPPV